MSIPIRYQGRPTQMPPKDPNATLKYGVDWEDYLEGETITASEWIAESGITVESSSFDATSTAARLSGGVDGKRYQVTNRITYTGEGGTSVDDRTILIPIREL